MNISKPGIKWGIIAGVVTIVVYVGAYLVDAELYFNSAVSWAIILFNLFAMYMASKQERNIFFESHDLGEEPYSFNTALQPPFLTYLITTVIFYVLNFVMFNVVNSELAELQHTITMDQLQKNSSMLEGFLGEDQFEKMIDGVAEQDFSVTLSSTFLSLATSLLGGFLLSAIFALIFKKNQIQRLS